MKFNDEVIAHIAKLIQLAILEGTDIVDHFRMIRLRLHEEELFLTEDYEKNFNENIERKVAESTSDN
jgi:hypothetical protein